MASEMFEKGLAVRSELAGKQYVEQAFKAADAFSLPMQGFRQHSRQSHRNEQF